VVAAVDSEEPAPVVAAVELDDDDDYEDLKADAKSEDSDDTKIKNLLQAWDNDEDDSSVKLEESDVEEEEVEVTIVMAATKKDLGLQDNCLDHIKLAAPNLRKH
jgi:hypothetical protein